MIFDEEMVEYEKKYYEDKDEKVLRITESEFAKMSTMEKEDYAYKKLFDFYFDEHTDRELNALLEEIESE